MKKTLLLFVAALFSLTASHAQQPAVYFDVGNPIRFDGTKFYLGWSSNPVKGYYLQEYFPKGETPERYNGMFTVSLHFSDRLTTQFAVDAKIRELTERKKKDACCNWQVYENGDERMLDFLVSAGEGDMLSVVEWNLHYYRMVEIDGQKALLLCFYSHRAYGDDIMPFLKGLKKQKAKWIEAMTELQLPTIRMK